MKCFVLFSLLLLAHYSASVHVCVPQNQWVTKETIVSDDNKCVDLSQIDTSKMTFPPTLCSEVEPRSVERIYEDIQEIFESVRLAPRQALETKCNIWGKSADPREVNISACPHLQGVENCLRADLEDLITELLCAYGDQLDVAVNSSCFKMLSLFVCAPWTVEAQDKWDKFSLTLHSSHGETKLNVQQWKFCDNTCNLFQVPCVLNKGQCEAEIFSCHKNQVKFTGKDPNEFVCLKKCATDKQCFTKEECKEMSSEEPKKDKSSSVMLQPVFTFFVALYLLLIRL